MPYSLTTLWHERQRFLPGVLAVAFSALLIILQCGLVLGLLAITSMPFDHRRADIWVGASKAPSVHLLYIQSSPRTPRSVSTAVADAFLQAYRQTCPEL
jgi:hypothetical protein